MNIDPLEIVAAIINFIILYFILKKYFFDKVNQFQQKSSCLIDKAFIEVIEYIYL